MTRKSPVTVSKLSRGAYKPKGTETVVSHDDDFGGLRTHVLRWDDLAEVSVETRDGYGKATKVIAKGMVTEENVNAEMAYLSTAAVVPTITGATAMPLSVIYRRLARIADLLQAQIERKT